LCYHTMRDTEAAGAAATTYLCGQCALNLRLQQLRAAGKGGGRRSGENGKGRENSRLGSGRKRAWA
jgi:hypothetical protein